MTRPRILLTNDDGLEAPGLWAAADALAPLGEVTVAAPDRQRSGAGRSFPRETTGRIKTGERSVGGEKRLVYAIDGSPAQVVLFALFDLCPEPPDLVVAGINYGENVGFGITISGTVGAVLEAAAAGISALAVSQQSPPDGLQEPPPGMDFSVAGYFTGMFAEKMLRRRLPPDVAALKVDVPLGAARETPWSVTRLSRARYYEPFRPQRASFAEAVQIPVRIRFDAEAADPGSDVHALHKERIVSVTPLSLDLTARAEFSAVEAALRKPDGGPDHPSE
jgi:5'-nucleotidase